MVGQARWETELGSPTVTTPYVRAVPRREGLVWRPPLLPRGRKALGAPGTYCAAPALRSWLFQAFPSFLYPFRHLY